MDDTAKAVTKSAVPQALDSGPKPLPAPDVQIVETGTGCCFTKAELEAFRLTPRARDISEIPDWVLGGG